METLAPKDHAERIALFRSEVVGALLRRDLTRGELAAEFRALSHRKFRPPAHRFTRTFSVPTLERWYYDYKHGGLEALRPEPRNRGQALALTPEQRDLLLDIRREHPSASASLILRTLVADGRLGKKEVSVPTLRRLYVGAGLDRVPMRDGQGRKTRLRWQAERPNAMWHGDVCHGPSLVIGGKSRPLRIHALLDDASRYIVALEAHHTEREVDMLAVLIAALRRHGAPDALYLDNGPTYIGTALRLACERLGITLIHPEPYDPQARGKMERFWRTLRQGCLDFLGSVSSLHDVNVRLLAFLDQHYHVAPHGALLGRAPGVVYAEAEPERRADHLDDQRLAAALTVREHRRVRRDTTVSVDGTVWELDQGFLAGRVVTVARCYLDLDSPPWVEHEGKRLALHPVDPVRNARRKRPPRREPSAEPTHHVPFDPPKALVDRAARRVRHPRKEEP